MPPALAAVLLRPPGLTIAVSGGVDSMTLAHVAHRLRPVRMVHAISPAVPEQATVRVRDHAARQGWHLTLIDAGEFDDPRYRANPLERCYFCKSNLYDRIAELVGGMIASGTNADDLSDFRPGLRAAGERGVIHPFVEAHIDKAAIRELARAMGLEDIADLPAQPCLASRVETGLRKRIDVDTDLPGAVGHDIGEDHVRDAENLRRSPRGVIPCGRLRCAGRALVADIIHGEYGATIVREESGERAVLSTIKREIVNLSRRQPADQQIDVGRR